MYSSLVARLPWLLTPDSASGLLRVLVVLLFLSCVWGESSGWYAGRAYVPTVLYLGYGGRLCRAVMEMCMYVCVRLYMRDGYLMDT